MKRLPRPGQAKTVSVRMAPRERIAEIVADDGHHRDQRVRQHVPPQHVAAASPFAVAVSTKSCVQRLDDAGTRHARDDQRRNRS